MKPFPIHPPSFTRIEVVVCVTGITLRLSGSPQNYSIFADRERARETTHKGYSRMSNEHPEMKHLRDSQNFHITAPSEKTRMFHCTSHNVGNGTPERFQTAASCSLGIQHVSVTWKFILEPSISHPFQLRKLQPWVTCSQP